ncbi:AzlC family ABC transporter permease [Agromyces seonyuensis]|uniref:Branched-chain amino acid ABC transporter permease n=1 Tax=Agromyces seonyuensis TaxID=2662446 RepID=A0A6I4NXP2_9MICO|nr:AzlC family ABC transporter permease [Agromyces seonyuensis]MWB99018.1 branched-chain amino acid ABC transporter permease [Agromyces seonyuensis]
MSEPEAAVPEPDDPAALARARRDGIAVGLATAAYGVSFGALSVASGLDVAQTMFLSLVMFTGGSQFALVGIYAAGGIAAAGTGIAAAGILGLRNAIYGMRMRPLIVGEGRGLRGWLHRIAAAWITIDESTAVALAQTDRRSVRTGFWVTGLAVFVGWNATTLVGALIGDALGDTRAWGLDAAAAAAFLGLLWPRLKRLQAGAVAVGAAVVAALTTPVFMAGVPVLVAALVAIVVGWFDWFGPRSRRAKEGLR